MSIKYKPVKWALTIWIWLGSDHLCFLCRCNATQAGEHSRQGSGSPWDLAENIMSAIMNWSLGCVVSPLK
jgi:hypothetical protein